MTSLSLPDSRRRFLQMLWLSAALHAAVIGLTRLPQQTVAAPLPELQVQLARPVAAVETASAIPEPEPVPQPAIVPKPVAAPLLPRPAELQPVPVPAPGPLPKPQAVIPGQATQSVQPASLSATSAREAPGPQINIPQLVDMRYYVVKELDAPPQTLRKPEPVYPPQAEDQGVSGSVLLRLHLEADGSISQSEVISSTPGGVFGELFRKSALDSVKSLRFRAAKRNGLPVRALLEITVKFEQEPN